MKKINPLLLIIVPLLFFTSCFDFRKQNDVYNGNPVREEAYVPVYGPDSNNARIIAETAAKATVLPGKIYVQGNLLFQVEKLAGVHIINYADVQNPVKLGFIKSRGCSEVAYKNGFLIINNLDDLVFVDVSDPAHIKESARVPHAFNQFYVDQYTNSRPPGTGKFYVCPDFNKGDIISWKLAKNVTGANCSN